MAERRGGAGDAGIADENVELAVTFIERRAEPGDAVEIGQVERHQCRAAAVLADLVIEFFEAALRSRHRDHMRAGLCQRARGGIADAARGAGHQSDTGGEGAVMIPGLMVRYGGEIKRQGGRGSNDRYVAMLRGVNVGGNSLKMDWLRAACGVRWQISDLCPRNCSCRERLEASAIERSDERERASGPVGCEAGDMERIVADNPFVKQKGIDAQNACHVSGQSPGQAGTRQARCARRHPRPVSAQWIRALSELPGQLRRDQIVQWRD